MGTREVFGNTAEFMADVLVLEDASYISLLQRLFRFWET